MDRKKAATPSLAGGHGSLLLTFAVDTESGLRVIGFVGATLDAPIVQANLEPNFAYQYNDLTGHFEKA